MTDDFAIDGQDAGYVPCRGEAAVLVADEEGAISGMATGYVTEGQEASALPAPEREAIVGSAVGFVPRPCCDIDWIYDVEYQDFVPPGAPDGVINALLGPEDNAAKYTGTITGGPTDSGRTWIFAEAVIDCPELVLANGRVDLYYEVEQETDHVIFSSPATDDTAVYQLGHLWLSFGPDPPAHYVMITFYGEVGAGNLLWGMFTDSFGGLFVSDSTFASPSGTSGPAFEAGTRYAIRIYINRDDPGGLDLKAKVWRTSDAEPVGWMFSVAGSGVQVSNTPLRRLRYVVTAVAQPGAQLQSYDAGERHLMALQMNDVTLTPGP